MDSDTDDPLANNAASADASQRSLLLQEYNRQAEKLGLRPLLFEDTCGGEQDDSVRFISLGGLDKNAMYEQEI